MNFNGPIGGLIEFAIGGGWGSEVPKENHSRVAVIRGTDIPKVASGDFSTVPFRYESDKKIQNRILAPGDLVLETAGGSSANGQYTGRTLLITKEILDVLGPTICASFCKKLVLNKDLVSPSYFYLYMQDLYKSGRVASYDSQSTGISNFQYEAFLNNELLELPKLEIQTAVASVLSSLQAKIITNSQVSNTLEDIAQTIFKSWFIDFDPVKAKMAGEKPVGMDAATAALSPDSMEESEFGMVPKGWSVRSLDDISEYLNGLAMQKFPVINENEQLPVIKIAQLRAGNTKGADMASGLLDPKFIIKDGDILFSWSGTLEVETWTGGSGALNQHLFKVTGKNVPDWYSYLSTKSYLSFFREIASGKATTMGHIQRGHLSESKLAIPNSEFLNRATEIIEPIISLKIKASIEGRNLAEIRDSLLPRLISGELQIPEEMLAS
jgi:type I restriction enzyme S subunit